MRKYRETLGYCAFCNHALAKATDKEKRNAVVAVLCKTCENEITRDLGAGWQETNWWQEFKESYVREEHQRVRQRVWSTETIADQEYRGYTANVPAATIDGKANEVLEGSVRKIITRLYCSYGYGGKRITHILNTVYKITITSRAVFYHLAEIKKTGITPNDDAKHWRDWHRELRRLERENGIVPTTLTYEDEEEDNE